MNYIDGYKFSEIADFSIDLDRQDFSLKMLNQNAIIYCKTDFLPQLFNHLRFSGRKYILITHMSDYPIDEIRFKSKPNSIIKWFAENAIYEHPDLISIPIGLENHYGSSKGNFTNHDWLINNINSLQKNPKDTSLYCNWSSVNPNTKQEFRKNIIETLEKSGFDLTIESGLTYENYCTSMASHQFVICPPGNGVDTHRLWEALYLGCIPITLKHRIYRDYNLPIIQVNNWNEVNEDLLNKYRYVDNEMLYMDYWRKLIKNEFSKL